MDDDVKRLIQNSAAETRRHFDTVAERLDQKVQLLAEGLLHVDEKINRVDTKVDALDEKINRVDTKVDALDEKINRVDTKVDALDEKINRVDAKVDALDGKINGVDAKVDGLDSKMARGFADTQAMIKFSHAELDRRLRTLEEVVSDLQARVERLESGLTH